MRRILSTLMVLLLSSAMAAPPVLPNPVDQQRYDAFTHGLRCLKCEHQSIAESDSEFAKDVKSFVAQQINEGRSDLEIKEMLRERFGDRIFLTPPWQLNTVVLWTLPILLIILGLMLWMVRLRRSE